MSIEAMAALSAGAIPQAPLDVPESAMPQVSTSQTADFGTLVSQGVARVNEELAVSEVDLQKLAMGGTENLHQIMMRLEQSRLSFQLLLQVRNRILESYQDVMRMQI